MNIDIKAQVEAALQTEWPRFEKSHPQLAAVIDQQLVVASIGKMLADDPEYRAAMANADGFLIAAEAAERIVHRLVYEWLGRLL